MSCHWDKTHATSSIPARFRCKFPTSSTLRSPSRSQFWQREKHNSRPERGTNESRMETGFFFSVQWEADSFWKQNRKKKTHHIELISRKPSHSRCIPLLSLAILPATANPARSDEEWKVVNRKWHVANGKHRRCVTHHLQPSDVYSIAYEKSTVQPGGCEIWRL